MTREIIEGAIAEICSRQEDKKRFITFGEFLELATAEPEKSFRDIFQLFHDMVVAHTKKEEDEYPNDPESIGYTPVNCDDLLVRGMDNPFFASRLFAHKFLKQVESFVRGAQQNKIYVFDGPPGCGKSTFLNNILQRFEEYANSNEGRSYEVFWLLKKEDFGKGEGVIEVPCPSHDHPILLIPKNERESFLGKILPNSGIKHAIAHEKQYKWIFERKPCTVCESLFNVISEKLGREKAFEMIRVRPYRFNRRLGQGVSILNPGDKLSGSNVIFNKKLQEALGDLFDDSQLVQYIYSRFAKTNNGVYALADIKAHNIDRLVELHNIISEGVHRVEGDIEESVNSLIIALMNPGDERGVKERVKNFESFKDRIEYMKMFYSLDLDTEIRMYESIFGSRVRDFFLPCVMENFARVIISTRMELESKVLADWIAPQKFISGDYRKFCDRKALNLRIDIAGGKIPSWLKTEDVKLFDRKKRKALVSELGEDGSKGFSGRDSVKLFNAFLAKYQKEDSLIRMNELVKFFGENITGKERTMIPEDFIASLLRWYNYTVLEQIKEAFHDYNKEQVRKAIIHYIFSVNFEIGEEVDCGYTGEKIKINEDVFRTCSLL